MVSLLPHVLPALKPQLKQENTNPDSVSIKPPRLLASCLWPRWWQHGELPDNQLPVVIFVGLVVVQSNSAESLNGFDINYFSTI